MVRFGVWGFRCGFREGGVHDRDAEVDRGAVLGVGTDAEEGHVARSLAEVPEDLVKELVWLADF